MLYIAGLFFVHSAIWHFALFILYMLVIANYICSGCCIVYIVYILMFIIAFFCAEWITVDLAFSIVYSKIKKLFLKKES